jgi:perosamine synthetase
MEKLALLGGTPVRQTNLPYARQAIDSADIAAVAEALTGDWITQGPNVIRLEEALAAITGAAHAVAVSNGTAALHAACWAAGLHQGDEAITTPLTFAATANALVYQGVRPIFADVDPSTLNIDVEAVKRAATAQTRAVIAVDFAGLPCEYDALRRLCDEHGWTLIADAAHSLGGA